jgi:RNA polymerase sigma factor (sigma-70 family)
VRARHGRRPIALAARTIDGYVVDRDHDLRRAPADRAAVLRPLGGEAGGTGLLELELGPIEELVAKPWRGDARHAALRAGWERLEQHLAEVAERTQDAQGDRRASAVAILIWRGGAAHPVLVAYDDGPGVPVQQRGVTYYDLDADWEVSARLGGPPSDLTHGRLAAVDVIAVDRNMRAAPLSGSRPGLSSPGRQRAPEIRPTGSEAGDESPGETEPPGTSSRPDLTGPDEHADSPSQIAVDVGALYAQHRPTMVDLAVRFVGDLASAEDVVQDAFMALHRNRAALRHPHAAMAYLRVSVVNRARSLLRHRAVARQHLTAAPESTESAEEIALLREEHREALAMVRRLPEGQRRVLFLRYWKDLTEREIAEELDISPGGVKSQASRGLAQVEQRLGQER